MKFGNSPTNAEVYLGYSDIDIRDPARTGQIPPEEWENCVVSPGQGLSMFIERTVQADFHYIESRQSNLGKGALRKLATDKGYDRGKQIHWFKLTEGRVMPSGLEVVSDNDPPGHYTLTVSRNMTVGEFMTRVSDRLGFDYVGTDVFGLRT